jgi:hypothetical protein
MFSKAAGASKNPTGKAFSFAIANWLSATISSFVPAAKTGMTNESSD